MGTHHHKRIHLPLLTFRRLQQGSLKSNPGPFANLWIAQRLQMGDPSRVSRYCAEAGSREEVRKISKRLEKAGSKN